VSGCFWATSLNEVKTTYERVRGTEVKIRYRGSVDQLEECWLLHLGRS
jgi:hypothetical protein